MIKNKFIIDKYSTAIYPVKIYVAKNYTLKDLQKHLENIEESDLNVGDSGICISGIADKEGVNSILILLTKKTVNERNTANVINICAHEALHATIDLMHALGQPVSPKYSEAYCYLCGYITECIYKTLKK